MTIALGIIIILIAVALTVLVLMQDGKGKELSSAIAGGSNNSYLGNSKISDKDKLLFKITAVLAAVLVVLVLVLYVIV